MKTLVVCGIQWGDEGKGKMTDYLAQNANVVVRYQGGNNAGHTVTFGGNKYALQSIPSGIFNPEIKNVMANGMVINPKAVIEELERLCDRGVKDFKLFISDRANVVMPYHIALDGAYENLKGEKKVGTTKKGIGPAYSDKYARIGIRMGDLLEPEYLKEKLSDVLQTKNMELKMLGLEEMKFEEVYTELMGYGKILAPYICNTSVLLTNEIEAGEKVLFEGAQGSMLCADHGTYPFVTSSSPTAASAPLGSGIAPKYINSVLGICKAYTTRVGAGPFPTEIEGEVADQLRNKGHEFGTVTGRPRRIGWLDCVALEHTCRISGVEYISIMLFDVLSGQDTVKICIGYELDGKLIGTVPPCVSQLERVKPVYEELPGWKEDITEVKTFDELPENAKKYIQRVEELTSTKAAFISVGPDRTQTIQRYDIF